MAKNGKSEFLGIGSQYLSFADNLFHKYRTLYNEQSLAGKISNLLFKILAYIVECLKIDIVKNCSFQMVHIFDDPMLVKPNCV